MKNGLLNQFYAPSHDSDGSSERIRHGNGFIYLYPVTEQDIIHSLAYGTPLWMRVDDTVKDGDVVSVPDKIISALPHTPLHFRKVMITHTDAIPVFDEDDTSTAAAALGRAGGSVTSDAKAAAARENGKRGGRPRKPVE